LKNETKDQQNAAITSVLNAGLLRIVLTWGANPLDLDAHLTGPASSGRFHVYFGAKGSSTSAPFAVLDVDDTTSYGPETITIHQQSSGIYRYSVHDYSNRSSYNSSALAFSGASVKVYRGTTLIKTFSVPYSYGTLWTVFELSGDDIMPVNWMSYHETAASTIP